MRTKLLAFFSLLELTNPESVSIVNILIPTLGNKTGMVYLNYCLLTKNAPQNYLLNIFHSALSRSGKSYICSYIFPYLYVSHLMY